MITPPTSRSLSRRRRKRRAMMVGTLTSVLVAAACGGGLNFSKDPQFGADLGIVDGIDPLTLGKRHFANRNFGLAIQAFEEAREIAPQSVNVLNALAVSYEEIGRSDIADSYFLEALDVDPSAAQTYNNWAMVQMGRGNTAKAQQLLAEAARLSPNDPVVNQNIARAEEQAGSSIETGDADVPTGALATVIAELKPQPEVTWEPRIRTVAPHIHFLETLPPDAVAPEARTGGSPTVLYPQVAAADIMPMPDPNEEQAPAPPAVPVSPVVEFELDSPEAAERAIGELASAEAGRTIIPIGGGVPVGPPEGSIVIRPGAGATVTRITDEAQIAALLPDDRAPVSPALAELVGPGAQIVYAEPLVAERPLPVGVGSWQPRSGEASLPSTPDGSAGQFLPVAIAPAMPPPGTKLVVPGDVGGEAPERKVVIPFTQVSADLPHLPAVENAPPVSVSVATDSSDDRALADQSVIDFVALSRVPVVLAALHDADAGSKGGGLDSPGGLAGLWASLPPPKATLPPPTIAPKPAAIVDASDRLPLVVALLAQPDPVAFEAPVVDNQVATSLESATTARLPSVAAILAMAVMTGDDEPGNADEATQN